MAQQHYEGQGLENLTADLMPACQKGEMNDHPVSIGVTYVNIIISKPLLSLPQLLLQSVTTQIPHDLACAQISPSLGTK